VPLPLYMDHNLHEAITRALVARKVNCLTARDDNAAQFDDEALLRRASELGRVVVTHDTDFLRIASAWLREGKVFNGVIFMPLLRLTIGDAVRDLELMAEILEPAEMINQVLRLPLA
jgi:predicted nuclease of predicted toxin-antitoxin system